MEDLLKKLNLTNQQRILLVNIPDELSALTDAFSARATVAQQPNELEQADYVMAFIQRLEQVEQIADWVTTHTKGDVQVWLVYPKQSSKKYRCEFNRDTGWASVGAAGFEPVRQVAINDDWSALRFRRAAYMKKITRNPEGILSVEGRKRVGLE